MYGKRGNKGDLKKYFGHNKDGIVHINRITGMNEYFEAKKSGGNLNSIIDKYKYDQLDINIADSLFEYNKCVNEYNEITNKYNTAFANKEKIFSTWLKSKKVYESTRNINNVIAKLFFEDSFVIAMLASPFVTGTAVGLATGLTAGRKCANVAGFCGVNAGEISRCDANNRSLTAKSMYNKHNMCGGFVGTNGETGTIKDCSSTGNEIHNKTYTGGHLGGFVGENSGKIENVTTTVPVTNGKCTGGFCGNNSGEIIKSESEGSAKATAATVKTKCGGFVGDNSGNINDCSSKGNAMGQEYVGGFAGLNKSNISGCNATGKATAKTKTHTALAGGFVGENEKGTIISCIATGGADSRSSSGQAKAGGFVGINKASIMSSKASGNVYLSAGTFCKDDGCGGFVGKNDQGGIIDGCYAESTVETTNKKKGGGFVGEAESNSTIKNSQCKAKIVTKSGVKNNIKFCESERERDTRHISDIDIIFSLISFLMMSTIISCILFG